MASEPKTSATSERPAAIAPASSVIRCWGPCPPTTSRIARAGSAPMRLGHRSRVVVRLAQTALAGPESSNCLTPRATVCRDLAGQFGDQCCGPCPPTTSRMARAGSAPILSVTDRGQFVRSAPPVRRPPLIRRPTSPVVGVVDAFCGLPDADYDRSARIHDAYRFSRTCRASAAVSDGVLPTLTPAASRASFLAAAVPDEPDTIAPAWPIVLPSGAVKPAT